MLQVAFLLREHVMAHHLGKVYVSPVDVLLGPTTVVQPDGLFVRHERLEIITDQNIQGPPDLCIEILSPGTESLDRDRKKAIYARSRVPEYWIVDPIRESVAVFELQGDGTCFASRHLVIPSFPAAW